MKVDIIGKVKNMKLTKTKALLPLFEAVINALQSVDELNNKKDSYVRIVVKRNIEQEDIDKNETGNSFFINSFVIEDNGVGFNRENFESFETSDSMYKYDRGGKGIGRFMWLKAFKKAEIDSIYEKSNVFYQKAFNFILDNEPIEIVIDNKEIDGVYERKTKVSLLEFNEEIQKACKKDLNIIAQRIIEHCISYFVLENCPNITLEDEFDKIDLNKRFKDMIKYEDNKEIFEINGEIFSIKHIKIYNTRSNNHRIHLCANQREVCSQNIKRLISDLEGKIKENDDNTFIYSAYIEGNYLNETVNNERTDFLFDEENESDNSAITRNKIIGKVVPLINNYLKDYLDPIKEKKMEQIREYVHNTSPQYRYILENNHEEIEKISPKVNGLELELALYKTQQKVQLELKEQGEQFIKKTKDELTDLDEYKEEYKKYIEKENYLGKSNLAQYIAHRKVIIELFKKALQIADNNKYFLEEYVHQLIFPMRETSDNIDYEQHNLWMIDEKLAYHYYLASDKTIKSMDKINSENISRPDILIIDRPILMVEEDRKPYNSMVIFEFKRPMRDDYTGEKNPITQVYDYIREIRNGGAKDRKGRIITLQENTHFYVYIIADMTPRLIKEAENSGYEKTPDADGYFGTTNKSLNAYVEIISYDKLLNVAEQRNRILFDKLFG